MGRRKQIVRFLDLRDRVLTRISIEQDAGVLRDLLLVYQEITKIMEHKKKLALEKAFKKVKPVQENNGTKRVKLANPTIGK